MNADHECMRMNFIEELEVANRDEIDASVRRIESLRE